MPNNYRSYLKPQFAHPARLSPSNSPRLPAALLAGLERLTLTTYRLIGCRDYARLDFRLDAHQQPRFLECNALPGLNPITGDLVLLSQPTLPYAQLIHGILQDALARHGMSIG